MIRTRKGRSEAGRRPLSSFGFMERQRLGRAGFPVSDPKGATLR